jgi:hypothetical protein
LDTAINDATALLIQDQRPSRESVGIRVRLSEHVRHGLIRRFGHRRVQAIEKLIGTTIPCIEVGC